MLLILPLLALLEKDDRNREAQGCVCVIDCCTSFRHIALLCIRVFEERQGNNPPVWFSCYIAYDKLVGQQACK